MIKFINVNKMLKSFGGCTYNVEAYQHTRYTNIARVHFVSESR